MKNLSYKTLFIIFFFLLIGVIVLSKFALPNQKVSAAWWNDMWNYRKAISISNTSGSNLTDFQVSLSVGTSALIASGKMQSDCDDIRITDVNGNLLPYWIEPTGPNSCNQAADTRIWVKANSLPTSGATVYFYYGNSSATSVSSGQNTFIYFKNNFQTSDLGWNWSNGGVESGWAKTWANSNDNPGSTMTWIKNIINVTGQEVIVEFTVKAIKSGSMGHITSNILFNPTQTISLYNNTNNSTIANGNGNSIITFGDYTGWYGKVGFDASTGQASNIANDTTYPTYQFNANGWVRHVHKLTNSSLLLSGYSLGGLSVGSSAWTYTEKTITAGYTKPNNIILAIGEQYNESIWLREAFVRKYASVDPTPTLQSEEVGTAPIAYWKFDEGVGTTAYDSTSNQNNGIFGTGSSAPTWADESQCISGKCLKFDGIDDYIDSNLKYPNKNTDYEVSASAWVKLTSSNGYRFIVGGINGGRADLLINNSNLAECRAFDSSDHIATGTTNLNDGKWHHISCVSSRKTSNFTKLYVDGKLESTIDYSSTIGYIENIKISAGASAGKIPFNGFIDDVKIYSYARTAAQIKLDYNAGKAHASSSEGTSTSLGSNKNNGDLSDGLVGYWKMDEGVGISIADSSGIGYTATFGIGNSSPAWSSGKYGVGTSFDGSNDYINFGNPGLSSLSNSSISFWRKAVNTSAWLLFQGQTTSHYVLATSGIGAFYHANIGSATKIYVDGNLATTPLTDNNWHHYVITGVNLSSWTNLKLSNYPNFNYNGQIDEIRFYNRSLSPSEVSNLYNYAPGPVGYWDFNEASGTIANDKSGNANNGTLANNPNWTQGKIGGALNFNGTNNFVNVGNPQSLNPYYAQTISAWVKLDTILSNQASNYPQILGKRDVDTQRAYFFSFEKSSSKLYWEIKDSAGTYYTLNSIKTNWNTNEWYYVTAIFDGSLASNNSKIFINGALDNQTTWNLTYVPQTSATTRIGGGSYYLDGSLDEVKLYNYARTQKQIIEDMLGGRSMISGGGPNGGAIAHYKFDEGTGTTTYNSGLGGTGLNGSFGTGSSAPTWTNDGKFGKSLNFNNSYTYVKTSASILNNSSQFSASAWVKSNNTSQDQTIFSANPPFFLRISGSKFRIGLYTNSSWTFVNGNISLNNNTWYHLTLSYDGLTLKSYVNGQLDTTTSKTGVLPSFSTIFVGYPYVAGENYPFNGLIDEVKIYNYALTDDEVKQDYNQNSSLQFGQTTQTIGATTTSLEYCIPGDTSYCASPIAEYKMDEGVGSTSYDSSGNNNNGTIGPGSSAPSWVQGKVGKALSFDGASSKLPLNSSINLNGNANWTVSAWVKTSYTGSNPILSNRSGGPVYNDLRVFNSKISYLHYNGSWINETGNKNIADGKWHHLTWVNYSNQTMDMYVDGVGDTMGVPSALSSTGPVDQIGRDWSVSSLASIDHVKIYNYARTPAQIAYDYNKGGPVGWWKFDECQGNIAYDWSGIGNTGTISIGTSGTQNTLGTCAIGTSAAWTNGSTGKLNSSLNFDGTDDYINVGDPSNGSLDFGVNDFTTVAWFKTTSSTSSIILGKYNSYPLFYTRLNGSGIIESRIGFDSSTNFTNTSGTAVNDGNWHQIVTTHKRNGNMTKYIDGKIYGSPLDISSVPTRTIDTSNVFRIGSDSATTPSIFFNGQIDDVRIYNYALTSEQVKILYNGGSVSFN